MITVETHKPWIMYFYGLTHDLWWPIVGSTRWLGRSKIVMLCSFCGHTETATFKIPRFGEVSEPLNGRHPLREKFIREHNHALS